MSPFTFIMPGFQLRNPTSKMQKSFLILLNILAFLPVKAQIQESFKAPEPSKVYEFTKYDQIPVGEYTGIPNISIPLYSITTDDVNVPLTLQYHAGGIRVSEEASNTGLGWNLNFGMVTQTINGLDDLQQYTKRLMTYMSSPTIWPLTCSTMSAFGYTCGSGSYTDCQTEPSVTTMAVQDYNFVYTASDYNFFFPLQSYCSTDYNYATFDMEPDIFRANFFGHSIRFIKKFLNPGQGQIEVLDNTGYKVEMVQNNDAPNANTNGTVYWKITTPHGDQYWFTGQTNSSSSSSTIGDPTAPSGGGGTSTSHNWYITKIVTTKNKTITFDYTTYSGLAASTSYSQDYIVASDFNNADIYSIYEGYIPNIISPTGTNGPTAVTTYGKSATTEPVIYVSKITTPNQTVNFSYSDRIDRTNDKKLDNIKVYNNLLALQKQFNFSYDYFTSPASGNVVLLASQPQSGYTFSDVTLLKRLKLVSVTEVGNNPYIFTYNSTALPSKNSTALDFWGFYNGKTTNATLAPNPATLGYASLGNNGNDKSAYIDYTKACTLERITYPTGGAATYEYESHAYQKGQLDNELTNSNILTSGAIIGSGLRLKNLSLYDNTGALSRKTAYTYSGGTNITPYRLFTSYFTRQGNSPTDGVMGNDGLFHYIGGSSQTFTFSQFYGSSYLQPSLEGSYNAIGYSQVTAEDIAVTGSNAGTAGNGKTVWTFTNIQDAPAISNPGMSSNETSTWGKISLPSVSDIDTKANGKLLTTNIYAQGTPDVLLKTTTYTYSHQKSDLYYGNKINMFRSRILLTPNFSMVPVVKPEFLVGYYAIFGKHDLLSTETITEYFASGYKQTNISYTYNANDILISTSKSDPTTGEFYREETTPSSLSVHTAKNMLDLPVMKKTVVNGTTKEQYNYSYTEANGITVPSLTSIYPQGSPDPALIKKIVYDQYDSAGNVLQYHIENSLTETTADANDVTTSIIWGYNNLLPIAKLENCTYAEISALPSIITILQAASNSDDDTCFSGTCDEKVLRTQLNSLRSLLPNAMITTYTYNVGVGVTSVTDARGNTTFYEFDQYQRLKAVHDADGNIISGNEYHYKQ
ncbi:hypothetical protein RG47T_1198 [Mucilaginibacter polytrichastri]|uniref:YD repeat-containing protein n=1 Tax=Mucilaginibacter polytrichastri TaxID=1302689 RepID=A0A1Q5ZVF5_9SPHI|nr:hypothetical protein RG47T_1198 [Mucilaginibacter polytrichastri]